MTNLVALYQNTVAKFREPKPDVFFYGGCQKTRMPLRFIGTALLNRTLIIDRIECVEVFPQTGTSANDTAGYVYEGDIKLNHRLSCPYCGPSGFVRCGACGNFNCYGNDVRMSRQFCCAVCGKQARLGDGDAKSFAAALHIDRPTPPPFTGFDPAELEPPKPRLLGSPTKRLR